MVKHAIYCPDNIMHECFTLERLRTFFFIHIILCMCLDLLQGWVEILVVSCWRVPNMIILRMVLMKSPARTTKQSIGDKKKNIYIYLDIYLHLNCERKRFYRNNGNLFSFLSFFLFIGALVILEVSVLLLR